MLPKSYPWLPKFLHSFCVPILRVIFKIFSNVEIEGLENLPKNREGLIFASNHASELDPLLVGSYVPKRFRPIFYTTRKKSFYKRSSWRKLIYGGLLFEIYGGYPLLEGNKNYALSLKNHKEILQDSYSLSIFPEGIRTLDGTLGRGHGGVIYLSESSGAKIVPVGIKGNFGVTFRKFITGKCQFEITFGKPIKSEELAGKDYGEKSARLMAQIKDLL